MAIDRYGLRTTQDWGREDAEIRVLFIGDSATYGGSYIANSELFSTENSPPLTSKYVITEFHPKSEALPKRGRSPKSGHRLAAEGMRFPWRCNGGTISPNWGLFGICRFKWHNPGEVVVESNEEWKLWGKEDPLYGAAAWASRERGGSHQWSAVEFYDLGQLDWADFLEHWGRYGYDSESCVEIGCGPGRITAQLPQTFHLVHALDVSPDAIEYARKNITEPNVTWYVTDGASIPLQDNLASAVFSCHVFQHFASLGHGMRLFGEIHRVLKPCGTMMIHLPLLALPPTMNKFSVLARFQYRLLVLLSSMIADLRRRRMRLTGRKCMAGTAYDMDHLYEGLTKIGFTRIEFVTFPMQSNGALHSCCLATKA